MNKILTALSETKYFRVERVTDLARARGLRTVVGRLVRCELPESRRLPGSRIKVRLSGFLDALVISLGVNSSAHIALVVDREHGNLLYAYIPSTLDAHLDGRNGVLLPNIPEHGTDLFYDWVMALVNGRNNRVMEETLVRYFKANDKELVIRSSTTTTNFEHYRKEVLHLARYHLVDTDLPSDIFWSPDKKFTIPSKHRSGVCSVLEFTTSKLYNGQTGYTIRVIEPGHSRSSDYLSILENTEIAA